MNKQKALATKVHQPLVILSLICFLLFLAISYGLIKQLVFDSNEEQAGATIDIFKSSIRDDILNGFDSEVFRKCRSVLQNTLVVSVKVTGIDERLICDESKDQSNLGFALSRLIYFNSQDKVTAGVLTIRFQSDLAQSIILRILYLLVGTIIILLAGYWFFSNYLVRKETQKLTKLALMLTESDIRKLENCSDYFKGSQSRELHELCLGVEKLAQNWHAYQKELVRNEKLKAVNDSSRLLAHDIKSPLSAIKTVSQMLEAKPKMSKKLLDKAAERIEQMLTDIVNRNEQSNLNAQQEKTDVGNFFDNLAKVIKPTYQEFVKIDFTKNISQPLIKEIDPDLLERGIRNLIKNSVEATGDSGVIRVTLSKLEEKITICVEDNGPGLPATILSNAGPQPLMSTKLGGTGLGIMQAKQTAEQHGGELTIDSSPLGTKICIIF